MSFGDCSSSGNTERNGNGSLSETADDVENSVEVGRAPSDLVEFRFLIDGRELSPESLGDPMECAILADIKEHAEAAVTRIQCPDHGETARRVTAAGPSLDELQLIVEGCCESLAEAIERTLH